MSLLCGKTPRTGLRIAKDYRSLGSSLAFPCFLISSGAIEYKDGCPASCGNLDASSASPASCNSHFGYPICVKDERARIADAPTNPTAKPSPGVAQHHSAPGAFTQRVLSEERRAEGLSLHCACAIDQEEANPYSASRDITPAASTRVSYNWRNNPGTPNSEPLQVCHSPSIAPVRAVHCTGAAVWQCASIQASWLPWRHAAVKRTDGLFLSLLLQTTETDNMPSIDRLSLDPSVIRTTSITSNQVAKYAIYRVPPPEVLATVSSRHAPTVPASMVIEETSGAGVYSPRQARIPSTLNQALPNARTKWDGPAQIRNIPPLDQTALWTPRGAPKANSSSSSRSVVPGPTPRSWDAIPRASAPSSTATPQASSTSSSTSVATAAQHGAVKPLDVAARGLTLRQNQSWEIPVVGDEMMYSDLASQGTHEAENPESIPGMDPGMSYPQAY